MRTWTVTPNILNVLIAMVAAGIWLESFSAAIFVGFALSTLDPRNK